MTPGGDFALTVEVTPLFILFEKKTIRIYIGDCTVWFNKITRQRAGTSTELALFEFWAEITRTEELLAE